MYFDNFPKAKKAFGIPGVRMNRPIVPADASKTGDVGIEFEIEATNNLPTDVVLLNKTVPKECAARWMPKEDHSLRAGLEYVLSSPAKIEYVPELADSLYASFKEYSSNLRFSNRCSTHVHLNASGWKVNQLVSFTLLWSLFEPVLIDWCGPYRKTNHFCLSVLDTPETLDSLNKYLKEGIWKFNDGVKYSSLNLLRLHDFGSVEIRCGDAFKTPEKMVSWVKFLHQLKLYAMTQENPAAIPAMVSGDTPKSIFSEICEAAGLPNFHDEVAGMQSSFDRVCMTSFREAFPLALYPWDDWLPEINKEYVVNPFEGSKKVYSERGRGLREGGQRLVHGWRGGEIDAPVEEIFRALNEQERAAQIRPAGGF